MGETGIWVEVFQPIGREGKGVALIGSEEESRANGGERVCKGEE